MELFVFLLGVGIVLGTSASVFTTLVVPRSTSSRLLRSTSRGIARVAVPLLRRLPGYEAKDRLLNLIGPLAMVVLFVLWLSLFVVGFGCIAWWVADIGFVHALEVSGSSVFTLGVTHEPRGTTQVVEFVAAGTGLLVVALEIAYLPALYAAFSARETEVTLLATRAGRPAWGPEILARHHRFETMGELPDLYRSWERWAAAVSESHTSYPTLMWFRSPDPSRSWILALVAMLDSASMYDALCPGSASRQTTLFLAMGIDCVRGLARALQIPYDTDPLPTDPIRLTRAEFGQGVQRLTDVGFPIERDPEEAWRHFCGWRVNYEGICDELVGRLLPPPAPWIPERPALGRVQTPNVLNRTPDNPEGRRPREV